MANRIVAYASISTGNKDNKQLENISHTKIFRNIVTQFENMYYNVVMEKDFSVDGFDRNATLYVDVLMYRNKRRPKLNKIIELAKDYKDELYIVVTNINAFGTADEIRHYYNIFQESNIYVLCPDHNRLSGLSEYSTCGYGFVKRSSAEINRALSLVADLDENEIDNKRGRPIITDFSNSFEAAYWLYESYQIPEKIALMMAGLSKTYFHRRCECYEKDKAYAIAIYYDKAPKNVEDIPKRYAVFPDKFDELSKLIETQTLPIEDVMDDICIELRIPTVHPTNYRRLKLRKFLGDKGILAKYKNFDANLIHNFNKYVGDDYDHPLNDPTLFWEKYKNGTL